MGYYTCHDLEIYKNNSGEDYDCVFNKVKELLDAKDVLYYALDDNLEAYNAVKWYEHKRDMKEISTTIKDVVFKLHGEGEECGDLWDEYYLNGKVQVCEAHISYDKFDESKLRE